MAGRILIADDDEDIRAYLELTLRLQGYEVVLATNGIEAVHRAATVEPDVVLLDLMMPEMDGLEALRRIREDLRCSHLPVLLVTARVQRDDILEGLSAGADDYITKPFDTAVLLARVDAAIRRAGQDRARNPLTGLPGNERILAELTRRLAEGTPFALLYIDLDRFKPYNDHYGFLRGDEALHGLADLLRVLVVEAAAPDEDPVFLGHVGGDDFVIVAPARLAEGIADELCVRFDALAPSFYDPADRAAGCIEVADRRGVPQRFGLLSLSVGIASTDRRDFTHHGEVVTVATEMKRFAKSRPSSGSGYEVDRRRDEDEVIDLEIDLP